MSWIERCNSRKLFGVCNTVASLTKNFLAFATLLQVPRKIFWRLQHCCKSHEKLFGVCNTVASPTKNFLAFATPLQVPRKTFWRLQHRCKSHEKLFGVCNIVASPTKNFLAFATLLQAFPKRFGHGVASVGTLCWPYSYIELTLRIEGKNVRLPGRESDPISRGH